MTVKAHVKSSQYYDSVSLMLVARELSQLDGVDDAAVVMATDANKSILAAAGLLTAEVSAASANDLVIAVSAEDGQLADGALRTAEGLLQKKTTPSGSGEF